MSEDKLDIMEKIIADNTGAPPPMRVNTDESQIRRMGNTSDHQPDNVLVSHQINDQHRVSIQTARVNAALKQRPKMQRQRTNL